MPTTTFGREPHTTPLWQAGIEANVKRWILLAPNLSDKSGQKEKTGHGIPHTRYVRPLGSGLFVSVPVMRSRRIFV